MAKLLQGTGVPRNIRLSAILANSALFIGISRLKFLTLIEWFLSFMWLENKLYYVYSLRLL